MRWSTWNQVGPFDRSLRKVWGKTISFFFFFLSSFFFLWRKRESNTKSITPKVSLTSNKKNPFSSQLSSSSFRPLNQTKTNTDIKKKKQKETKRNKKKWSKFNFFLFFGKQNGTYCMYRDDILTWFLVFVFLDIKQSISDVIILDFNDLFSLIVSSLQYLSSIFLFFFWCFWNIDRWIIYIFSVKDLFICLFFGLKQNKIKVKSGQLKKKKKMYSMYHI